MDRPLLSLLPVSLFMSALVAGCAGSDSAAEASLASNPPPSPAPLSGAKGGEAPGKAGAAASKRAYPATAKRPVVDVYHGVSVTDDYRWLEKTSDPEVTQWIADQNKTTRGYLDALPGRKALKERIAALVMASPADRFGLIHRGGQLFAMKFSPPKQQPLLVVMKSEDSPAAERVLVDPGVIDPAAKTSIDFYVPSHDGKKVAVSLSKGGSESGTVHVFDVATGKETGDVIPRVNGGTAGGSLEWTADSKGFYYTRYPAEGERPAADLDFYQQVYFHKLGAKVAEDTYSIGKDFPRIAEIELHGGSGGKYIVASVKNGDGGEELHHLLGPSGKWQPIASLADHVTRAKVGGDKFIYLLTIKGAPRGRILRVPVDKPDLAKAEVVVPESDVVIEDFEVTPGRLYVTDLVGGPSQIRAFDAKGTLIGSVPILPVSSVKQVVPVGGDTILFRNTSYLEPAAWYRYDAKTGKTVKTGLFTEMPVSFADTEVVREMCTSKDGTKVPLNILRRKGTKLDGSNPVLLNGYGGFRISQTPRYGLLWRVWLDQGGVYAIASLRGGGEFGEEWHMAGNLTKKQNVFDDFVGCARFVVDAGYTKPERLAIIGGSNGGLLVGAAMTQHPELFKVVIAQVGLYDMLRFEQWPNGVFNVTEFGTVKDPEQFKAIYAYSPYQRVKDGAPYPAALFVTGANDPRVDPAQSRKMVARLQAATSSDAPILLLASSDTGHGMQTALGEVIEQQADIHAFLLHELGLEYKGPSGAGK